MIIWNLAAPFLIKSQVISVTLVGFLWQTELLWNSGMIFTCPDFFLVIQSSLRHSEFFCLNFVLEQWHRWQAIARDAVLRYRDLNDLGLVPHFPLQGDYVLGQHHLFYQNIHTGTSYNVYLCHDHLVQRWDPHVLPDRKKKMTFMSFQSVRFVC